MAGLRDLKRRIVAVKSIKGVTEAMSNIAAAKLTIAWVKLNHARAFAGPLEKAVSGIAVEPEDVVTDPRYHIFGSDNGLCGSMNTLLHRNVRKTIAANKENGVDKFSVFVCGEKMRGHVVPPHSNHIADHGVIGGAYRALNFKQICELTSDVCEKNPEPGQNVYMYQRMKSSVQYEITHETMPGKEQFAKYFGADMEFEGDNHVYDNLNEYLNATSIYRVLCESEASELCSRAAAMSNASKAAGDMIDALELTFRKVRQAKVTTEIIEICTGAAAVMDED